jgi:hypothetical protein
VDPIYVKRLWVFVLVVTSIAVVCILCGHVYIFDGGWMSASLAATAIAHVSSRPTRPEVLATLALSVALYAVGGSALDLGGLNPIFERAVSAFGLASLTMQVLRLVRMRSAQWTSDRAGYVALALLTPMFSAAFASSIAVPGMLRDHVYDTMVFNFDRALFGGHVPSFAVGRWLAQHEWLVAVATFCYWAPQPLDVFVYVAERRQRVERDLMTTLFIAGFVGFTFYSIFPVVGPRVAFSDFPYGSGQIRNLEAMARTVPRNCMPSLHLTDALIVAIHAWRLKARRWRLLGVVNVAFTILATLGFGYHYVVDLLAAIPFTFGVLGAARRDVRSAGLGWGATLALLLILRFGFSP